MNLTLDWLVLAPTLLPAAGVLVVLLLDALLPAASQPARVVGLLVLILGATAAVPGALGTSERPALSLCMPGAADHACLWSAGPAASALQLGILGACAAVLVLGLGEDGESLRDGSVEVVLVLAAATGGTGVVAARDLPAWLVLLELATVPTVALVALRGNARAAGGALSLLTTSLVSFAFLVLGAALWLLATGSPVLGPVGLRDAAADPGRRPLLLLSIVVLVTGLAFKLSAWPFHAWTPAAFTGASTPIAALLATASKLTATGAAIVVLTPVIALTGTPQVAHSIAAVLGGIALVSMLLGSVVMLRVTDSVRFLAFSTIAQSGWVLLPLAAMSVAGHRAAVGYVLTYAIATLVAFAAVAALEPGEQAGEQAGWGIAGQDQAGPEPSVQAPLEEGHTALGQGGPESTGRPLAAFRGMLRARPLVGGTLGLALLVLAGLPPGIIGLLAKVQALRPVIDVGLWPLAVVAVITVVIGIAGYLRWVAILVRPAPESSPVGARPGAPMSPRPDTPRGAVVVLGIGGVLLVVTSLLPQLLWGLIG